MRWTPKSATAAISWIALLHFITICSNKYVSGYSMIFMAAARRGQGKLKRSLDGDDGKKNSNSAATINQGKGQLVTGVSLPTEVNFFKFDPWKAF